MLRPRSPAPASSSASMPRALAVERGYVRPRGRDRRPSSHEHATDGEDQRGTPATTAPTDHARRAPRHDHGRGQAAGREEDDDDAVRPLPDRLVTELTAHRTLALRDAVACHPQVAMTALLHKLCVDAFQQTYVDRGALKPACATFSFTVNAGSEGQRAPRSLSRTGTRPGRPICRQTNRRCGTGSPRSTMPAGGAARPLCVARRQRAVREGRSLWRPRHPPTADRRLDQADRLARAVRLDMVEAGWRPTVDNYLGRVPSAGSSRRFGRGLVSGPRNSSTT